MIGFGVYANSLPNQFVWDDIHLIKNNQDIKSISLANLKTIFTHDIMYFLERSNFYRPLQSLSYMLDYKLWGENAYGFRLINILIHCINSIIIFLLLYRLWRNMAACFLSSLFFLVHPLNVSAVSYIAGRADLLALMFLLLSTVFLFRFKGSETFFNGAVSILFFIFSLLLKEICIIFPVFIFVFLYFSKENSKNFTKNEKLFISVYLLITVTYVILRLTLLKFTSLSAQAINAPDLYSRLLSAAPFIITYLRLIILPYDLRMDRDFQIPTTIMDWRVIGAVLLLAGIIYFFITYVKKEKTIALGAAWFFVLLFPSLNIIIPLNAPVSEHWLYIPFFGITVILAYLISLVFRKVQLPKNLIYLGFTLILSVYAGTTVHLNRQWRNAETLFSYITKFQQVHWRSYYNLGRQYYENGKYQEAIEELQKAIDANPEYYEALVYMFLSYANIGDIDQASEYFTKAIKVKPKSSITYTIFAQALKKAKKSDDAAKMYETAIRLDEKNIDAYNALGIIYAEKGQYEKAEDIWSKASKIDPDSKEINANLERLSKVKSALLTEHIKKGDKYASEGKYISAIKEYEKALEIDDKNTSIHNNLGVLYGLTGKDDAAIAEFEKVIDINPNNAGSYKNIAIIYAKYPEKHDKAIKYLRLYLEFPLPDTERKKVEESIEKLREQ